MNASVRGEKLEAGSFILPIGIRILLLAAVIIKTERWGFPWGIAIPSAFFVAVWLVARIGMISQTRVRQATFPKKFTENPASLVQQRPRMYGVAKLFRNTFVAFGVLATLGLVTGFVGIGHGALAPPWLCS